MTPRTIGFFIYSFSITVGCLFFLLLCLLVDGKDANQMRFDAGVAMMGFGVLMFIGLSVAVILDIRDKYRDLRRR